MGKFVIETKKLYFLGRYPEFDFSIFIHWIYLTWISHTFDFKFYNQVQNIQWAAIV